MLGKVLQQVTQLVHSCAQLDAALTCRRCCVLRRPQGLERAPHIARVEPGCAEEREQGLPLWIVLRQKLSRAPEKRACGTGVATRGRAPPGLREQTASAQREPRGPVVLRTERT